MARHVEVTQATYHRWRNQYGGMKADDAKRLRELERENARLKRIVADKELEIDALRHQDRRASRCHRRQAAPDNHPFGRRRALPSGKATTMQTRRLILRPSSRPARPCGLR